MNIIEVLKEEIRLLRNGKNSGTSHTPPSHQIGRSNAKSLRAKTERKSGGQKGHEGSTLKIKEVPDETINYTPHYSLSEIAYKLGYSSVAHLSNQFKKVTVPTPSHFKEVGKNKRKPIDKI